MVIFEFIRGFPFKCLMINDGGIMERNNNTCKLIKRIGFEYRNFDNFKARILIITNLFRHTKKNAEKSLSTL